MEERKRLSERDDNIGSPWYKWGPYLSERSWGSVREDYSQDGNAWDFFPFSEAHRRVYRWGEDGIAGWCDRYQVLAFALAFWNGKDPILKERLFGLNSYEGNHGEDVKEYYYYLDATPTHSYMKYLYKYPHGEFPYTLLKEQNRQKEVQAPEYELVDTGVFAENNYFDITIEYAKASSEDTAIRVTAINRGVKSACLHLIPHLWFRNQWRWSNPPLQEPVLSLGEGNEVCLVADDSNLTSPLDLKFDYHLGKRYLYGSQGGEILFTNNENESEMQKYRKDAFHRYLIQGEKEAVNPDQKGTKGCIHYFFPSIEPNQSVVVYLRLTDQPQASALDQVKGIIEQRRREADEFYQSIHPPKASQEECLIQRQALAGMLWTKQFYLFDVKSWLKGDSIHLPPQGREKIRNEHWQHLNSKRILSMPDKWEYPWFAAWDLAFHCLTLALVDIQFAKEQLWLLLFEQFQHPNGAIPAYEWNFSDLNPPVQAWAALKLYQMEKAQTGKEDRVFLENCFFKLMLNFSYWVNQVDSSGCNVFEGGFLGLDNIALMDRSVKVGDNVMLKQSDGTGWMAMFSLNLMRLALELAKDNPSYETIATKFFQHFVHIGHAMKTRDNKKYSLWDEQDGFFYDVLVYSDDHFAPFRVRSLVGLIPLYAIDIITKEELSQYPSFQENFVWFLKNRPTLTSECIVDKGDAYSLSLVNEQQLQRILQYLCNPQEFRSSFGIRSLSKYHESQPFIHEQTHVGYEPGVAVSKIKGGNSNWRGPIWLPTNYLLIESLKLFGSVFPQIRVGDLSIAEISDTIRKDLISLFKKNDQGKRPIFNAFPLAQDPHFQDLLLFHEYFHAETGEGLGACHQTGWTGLIANLIDQGR